VTLSSPLAICDADVCEENGWTIPQFASACLDGGATCLQLRAKHASSGWFLRCAEAVMARATSYKDAVIIVNDRADIARLSGAGGVHIGQEDLAPSDVRAIVGEEAIVGLSTHTPDQLMDALEQPVSYVAIGPVFETGTKRTGYDAVGLGRVREVADAARRAGRPGIGVVAIGGITFDRARSVIDAGADAVAVITDLLKHGDPSARVAAYLRVLSTI
jgi:thiamine-phosphate pyrophosphorylase